LFHILQFDITLWNFSLIQPILENLLSSLVLVGQPDSVLLSCWIPVTCILNCPSKPPYSLDILSKIFYWTALIISLNAFEASFIIGQHVLRPVPWIT
jgi:hypothetical protein